MLRSALLVSCFAVAIAACGGDDAPPANGTTGATAVTETASPETGAPASESSGAEGTSDRATTTGADSGTAADASDTETDDTTSGEVLDVLPSVATGGGHTCALLESGAVRCWGRALRGQLGYGDTTPIGTAQPASTGGDVEVGGITARIATGEEHTCVVLVDGAVRCWGSALSGQLGYGNTDQIGDDETPAEAGDVAVGGVVTQIAAGQRHTCALLQDGAVRCWGFGSDGRLGYGNVDFIGDDETPADAGDVDVGGPVTQIATGDRHTCALLDTGSVRCWGTGDHGGAVLGYALDQPVGDDETPASVGDVDVGGVVVQVAAGGDHTCALLEGGAVRCWGRPAEGALGYGNMDFVGADVEITAAGDVDVGDTVTQIAAGFRHTCAVLEGGAARCWGLALFGRLGYGSAEDVGDDETPATAGDVDVGGVVTQIATGGRHTCALLDNGAIRCWGEGIAGQLGYGNTDHIGDDESPASAGDVPFL